jgi:hypothetical protein
MVATIKTASPKDIDQPFIFRFLVDMVLAALSAVTSYARHAALRDLATCVVRSSANNFGSILHLATAPLQLSSSSHNKWINRFV